MLHLRDVLADPLMWEKLRRFLRSGRLQLEEPGVSFTSIATVSLVPEAVDVEVKIVLIGSREQYYELQEALPTAFRPARTRVAPRLFLSPMPAASMGCRIFRPQRWHVCWRSRIARPTTSRVKARYSPAPRRW